MVSLVKQLMIERAVLTKTLMQNSSDTDQPIAQLASVTAASVTAASVSPITSAAVVPITAAKKLQH